VIATQFVQGLSSVIRYSLQNNSAQTVALSTELKVTDAFLFLNRQRFGERLQVEIDVSASARSKHIASHALLILVENAIKHNEISAEIPLLLRIYDEDDGMSLTVVNSLILKPPSAVARPRTVQYCRAVQNNNS
jgi:LytS/YehU family sensor histidine kinase